MRNEKERTETREVLRTIVGRERKIPTSSSAIDEDVREAHEVFVINGNRILEGQFRGAETLTAFESLVYDGGEPAEVLIAVPAGGGTRYSAAWPKSQAQALENAIRFAEESGRKIEDFSIALIPEVGFTAVWLENEAELIPLLIEAPTNLQPKRIYSEAEVIEALRQPLKAALATAGGEPDPSRPPIGG